MNFRLVWYCEKKLPPTTWQAWKHDLFLKLALRGWAPGPQSASGETADGLCVESFTLPVARPGQNSPVFGSNLLFLFSDTLRFKFITFFGIYSPVGCCKAWFFCQHRLQPAGITDPLWMGSPLKAGQSMLFSTLGEGLHGLMKRHETKQANAAGYSDTVNSWKSTTNVFRRDLNTVHCTSFITVNPHTMLCSIFPRNNRCK